MPNKIPKMAAQKNSGCPKLFQVYSRSNLTDWSDHPLINSHTALFLADCHFLLQFWIDGSQLINFVVSNFS
jgi:hypothetical protein